MNRRKLLKAAGAAVVTGAVAAPAIAQSAPTVRWRLATSFPKNLDTLYGACEMFSKAVAELSDQKFLIQVFGPGEIVPAFQVFDAVANNTVEMGNSGSYYYIGKDLSFAFGTAVPFGLNTRQMNAWLDLRRRHRSPQRALWQVQRLRFAVRQYHCANGRMVPQGDQDGRRSQGSQVPLRRHGRSGSGQARRRAAADPAGRHLSGAREGHHRCRRVDRPLRRREARFRKDRALLLLSRLVGRLRQRVIYSSTPPSGPSCPKPISRW